jgi:hypothetical protein
MNNEGGKIQTPKGNLKGLIRVRAIHNEIHSLLGGYLRIFLVKAVTEAHRILQQS